MAGYRDLLWWFRCNIFNKHSYGDCGYTDLYGQRLWLCQYCERTKHKNYDAKLVEQKSKEIREGALRVINEGI